MNRNIIDVEILAGTALNVACSRLYYDANKSTDIYSTNFNGIIITMKQSDTRIARERIG